GSVRTFAVEGVTARCSVTRVRHLSRSPMLRPPVCVLPTSLRAVPCGFSRGRSAETSEPLGFRLRLRDRARPSQRATPTQLGSAASESLPVVRPPGSQSTDRSVTLWSGDGMAVGYGWLPPQTGRCPLNTVTHRANLEPRSNFPREGAR